MWDRMSGVNIGNTHRLHFLVFFGEGACPKRVVLVTSFKVTIGAEAMDIWAWIREHVGDVRWPSSLRWYSQCLRCSPLPQACRKTPPRFQNGGAPWTWV